MRSDRFHVRSDRDGDVIVISVAGEVDIATAPALHAALEHPDLDGTDHILVDLSETSFLESSGLRALLMASPRTSRTQSLSIVCPNANVRRVFELTGVAGFLALHEDREDALQWHQQLALSRACVAASGEREGHAHP